jgi:iron complex outermembrane receptor protein
MKKLSQIAALLAVSIVPSQLWAASVNGVVTDTTGKPVQGAVVSAEGSTKKAVTNDAGEYTLVDIADGHVHLHVYSVNHVHGDLELDGVSGSRTANFELATSTIENIVVTANAIQSSVLESVIPVSVLSGTELRNRQAPTLGETLKATPGVHSSYFGPVAATPIIRGNDGPRVKITQNSLDVSDASRVGADHNVGTDAGTAVQIEVLRGPATLQYGSGAIGGVVNVVDNRIPTYVPQGLEGETEIRHETATNERFAKADLNAGAGNWAFHLDAFTRETDDVEIPGFAEREPDEGEEPGILEDSAIDGHSVTAGLSYISDKGFIGFSVQQLDNLYGIPGGHGHEEEEEEEEEGHEEEEEGIALDVDNTRYQIAGELLSPFEGVSKIKLAAGYTDYVHVEQEGDEIGTTFANQTSELRLTAETESIGGWHGVIGLHLSGSDFEAVGEEAFTPPSETDMHSLFVIQQKTFGDVTVQLGARVERNELSAASFEVPLAHEEEEEEEGEEEEELTLVEFDDVSYTSVSLSAGYNWAYSDGYSLALNLSRSERAPSAQELFSAGEHVSTRTFDLGALFTTNEEGGIEFVGEEVSEEVSNNIDLTWRKFSGNWGFTVTAFYNQIDDYLYQADTGFVFEEGHHEEEGVEEDGDEEEEGLPILNFVQEDADLYGFEAEVHYQIDDVWSVSGFGDFTRAEVDSGNLPRIPPLRLGGEVAFAYNGWQGDVGVIWYDDQDRVADFESQTDGYTLIEAGVDYTWATQDVRWIFYARGTNLTDEEARVHSSFLVDDAPLPGRGFTLGVRAQF